MSSAARTIVAARSSGRSWVSDPLPARPIGERAVATMTASGTATPSSAGSCYREGTSAGDPLGGRLVHRRQQRLGDQPVAVGARVEAVLAVRRRGPRGRPARPARRGRPAPRRRPGWRPPRRRPPGDRARRPRPAAAGRRPGSRPGPGRCRRRPRPPPARSRCTASERCCRTAGSAVPEVASVMPTSSDRHVRPAEQRAGHLRAEVTGAGAGDGRAGEPHPAARAGEPAGQHAADGLLGAGHPDPGAGRVAEHDQSQPLRAGVAVLALDRWGRAGRRVPPAGGRPHLGGEHAGAGTGRGERAADGTAGEAGRVHVLRLRAVGRSGAGRGTSTGTPAGLVAGMASRPTRLSAHRYLNVQVSLVGPPAGRPTVRRQTR